MNDADDYVELSGEELRQWADEPHVAGCNRCGRKTWETGAIGTEDRMPQPDGNPCGGRFVAAADGGGHPMDTG
jgi:hypothetical protein